MSPAEYLQKKPFRKITPRAIRAWQWSAGFGNLVYALVPLLYGTVVGVQSTFDWVVTLVLAGLVLILWVLGITLLPYLQWKKWRYAIDENEIDLKRGVLVEKRTLIPLRRVQHVDTRQGPLLRYYNLASVTISTAATTHEIPALDERTADKVRDIISRYARLAEEDV